MSEQRLQQLKDKLETRGWYITDLDDATTWTSLIKVNEDGHLQWKISRKTQTILLSFFLTTHFGGRTKDLRNIHYVSAINSNVDCLWFNKINSKEWRDGLLHFINNLDFQLADFQ